MSDNPSAEEQERLAAQMKAKPEQTDPQVAAAFSEREKELNAQLTAERAKREDAERRASDAEARALASQPQSASAGRQLPIYYTIKAEHLALDDDKDELEAIVADINESCKNIKGFKSLTVGDFLALNQEALDAEAQAHGFSRGARHAFTTDAGATVGGYALFAGTQVVVGIRDTSKR